MRGRDYVIPQDVVEVIPDVLRHRLVLTYDALADEISAETVIIGDPKYAGPLAETQLGLDVYHILEEEVKSWIPAETWDDQVGLMADVLDVEEIATAVRGMRDRRESFN